MDTWFDFIGQYGLALIAGLYISMCLIERAFYAVLRPGRYDDRNALASFSTNIFANLCALAVGTLIPLLTYAYVYENFRLLDPGYAAWTWVAAFFIHDLAYFFGHWIGHRTGFFWAWHQPHHSSEELNLTTAARGFAFGDPLAIGFSMIAAIFGVHPLVFLTVLTLKNVWGIFNHTRLIDRMGWMDEIFATPSNHRVHHGRDPDYIDRNYGQVLILWDRLFGTFARETHEPDYGLVEPMTSNNPIRIHFDGWMWLYRRLKQAPNIGTAVQYLWRPPEWHHAGECHGCAKARKSLMDPAE